MLKVNGARLWEQLMSLAEIGATPAGGVRRVTLSEEDRIGRDWFVRKCEVLGCSVEVDPMGNLFARRDGKDNSLPAVMMGSHLDSQPTGGKYDGAYGVLAGLEVIETLNEADIITDSPLEVVSWTNEEGARFAPAMIGSGVFAGEFTLDYAYSRKDKDGVLLGDALNAIEYTGEAPLGRRRYAATFELHIEQGPILEAEQKSVGVVTGVQGIRWYDLVFAGQETHAGPSPMSYRRDPVRRAVAVLDKVYALSDRYAPDARVTIGELNARPGVRNTVPGTLTVAVDLRHPDEQTLTAMDADLKIIASEVDEPFGVETHLDEVWYSPPVVFDPKCVDAVRNAVRKLEIPTREMVSGAGHDAVYVSRVAPTSMIFIPCKDGLSHNEAESIEHEDATNGANTLLHAVLDVAATPS
ncbi:MAG: Zn-dependent hydrolase [Planctomycetota bacterium]